MPRLTSDRAEYEPGSGDGKHDGYPPSDDTTRKGAAEMRAREGFTTDEARQIGEEIGIDWASSPFNIDQFQMGMDVELEHGLRDPLTNVTGDEPTVTAKIALAHLKEFADYYTRLARMEDEAAKASELHR